MPNYIENPFDLMVLDHVTHFDKSSICRLISNAGLEVINCEFDWVIKELTIVAKKPYLSAPTSEQKQLHQIKLNVRVCLEWLGALPRKTEELLKAKNKGIFGTAIAAIWLYSELNSDFIDFFVDEDRARVGKKLYGLPIYSPLDIPEDSCVFLALPPILAQSVLERVNKKRVDYCPPPEFNVN